MRVLHDRILVCQNPPKETTESGLFLPSSQIKPSDTGIVVAIGNKVNLRVGDLVKYPADAGIPLQIDGKNYLIMKEHQILLTYEVTED